MYYLFADCVLDTQCYLLRRAGQSIRLRPKVFHMLIYLLMHRDRVIPKHELCEQVWSSPAVSDTTIDNCLKAVRHAIGDTGQAQHVIETRYGHGYRFVATVTLSPDGSAPEAPAAVSLLSVPAAGASPDAPVALEAACPPPSPVPLATDDALPAGEWKVVTLLWCALMAPAVQGAQRCLETWQRQLHTLHALACHEAQRYEGLVRAVSGEGVLIVFGAPVAQEDHAPRAVLTALSMQRQLADRQGARASLGVAALQVSMSLHTGRVTVGESATSHATSAVVLGETVARAVALQARATPGAILCSEATARLVQRMVCLKALPLGSGDGPATPERLYQVLGQPRRRTFAVPHLAPARKTCFVGRAQELATLHALWARVTQGQGHVVSVVGEAGMGKSRLVAEFRGSLRREPHMYVQGRCVSYGQAMAYQPVLTLLRHACGITPGDRPAVMAVKVHRCLHKVGMDPAVAAPYLLHLLGSAAESLKVARKWRCHPCEPHQTWLSRSQVPARACRSSSL